MRCRPFHKLKTPNRSRVNTIQKAHIPSLSRWTSIEYNTTTTKPNPLQDHYINTRSLSLNLTHTHTLIITKHKHLLLISIYTNFWEMANPKLACMVLVCMALVACTPHAVYAITCGQITSNLIPCVSYLQRGGPVPPRCCNGIRSIANAARTTVDRRTACNCLKSAAARAQGINLRNAESLPSKCNVRIPYKISISIDCARYITSTHT